MKQHEIVIKGIKIKTFSLNTVVVGSGAAGLNAADRLYHYGQPDIAIVTEGLNMGTSRNTGSDKQTYYKLTLAGSQPDSVRNMACTLFQGGAMDGDIALVEAALSAQCFYRLGEIGVPFPCNSYGESVGYKTDHDPVQRATSAGPLTSRFMTEMLEKQVLQKNIPVFDGYQVIAILTSPQDGKKAVGLLALNLNGVENAVTRYTIFNCTNIIYATGGPAGMYAASVYPESQTGASGIAFEAGVIGKNVTESQYGIASLQFRWNLSGTYQQVLPRYLSTDQQGNDPREFLLDYFTDSRKMLRAVFLKGYQWPFDPRKIENQGSSLIDILVYYETVIKGRRVFLDYRQNPVCPEALDFNLLDSESRQYLGKSNALFGTPFERLCHMNQPAVDLYLNNGIDLSRQYLEIAVCAQHNNGGLAGNCWWESNLGHFFPVGEVNGTHGIYRPGGSALNSGQVGSTRAARFITARYARQPLTVNQLLADCGEMIKQRIGICEQLLQQKSAQSSVAQSRQAIAGLMSRAGAHIRSQKSILAGLKWSRKLLNNYFDQVSISSARELAFVFKNYDMLITQIVYLSAIENYIEQGGGSRGSYLIHDQEGILPVQNLPDIFRYRLDKSQLNTLVQEVKFDRNQCLIKWRNVRSMPRDENWFETVWNDYLNDRIIPGPA